MFDIEISCSEKSDGSKEYGIKGFYNSCRLKLYRKSSNSYILKDNDNLREITKRNLNWISSAYYRDTTPYPEINLNNFGGDIIAEGLIYLYLLYRFSENSTIFTKLYLYGSCNFEITQDSTSGNKTLIYYDITHNKLKLDIIYTYDTLFKIHGEETVDTSNIGKEYHSYGFYNRFNNRNNTLYNPAQDDGYRYKIIGGLPKQKEEKRADLLAKLIILTLLIGGIFLLRLLIPSNFNKDVYFEQDELRIKKGTTEYLEFTCKDPDKFILYMDEYLKDPEGHQYDYYIDINTDKDEHIIKDGIQKVKIPIKGLRKTNKYYEDGYIQGKIVSTKSNFLINSNDIIKIYVY